MDKNSKNKKQQNSDYPTKSDSYEQIKAKFDTLLEEIERLNEKIIFLKKGMMEIMEHHSDTKFNTGQRNKFLYNIDPPEYIQKKYDNLENLTDSELDYLLDDGCTDGDYYKELMEYQ